MRGAARQPRDDPSPERPDLEARVAQVCASHQAVIGEIRAGLKLLAASPCDPQIAAMLADRLRLVAAGAFDAGIHMEEMRGALAEFTAANKGNDRLFNAGRAYERAQIARESIPGPRHRRGSAAREPGRGQLALIRLQGVAFLALAGKALKPLWQHAGHVVGHPATWKLTAHTAKLATGAAAGAGTVAAVTVIALSPAVSHAASGSDPGSSATVPGWRTSAEPIPSSSQIALTVVHPKVKHAAKGRTLLSASGVPAPLAGPQAGPAASASPSSSPVVSAQAGPATLSVSAASLDLSVISQAQITISASGAGWAAWRIGTSGTDLSFSKTSGVLQAGQSATVTVSLASALDGLAQQVFTVAGQSVTVSLPLPLPAVSAAPVPSVSVSVSVSVPAPVLPGVLPG